MEKIRTAALITTAAIGLVLFTSFILFFYTVLDERLSHFSWELKEMQLTSSEIFLGPGHNHVYFLRHYYLYVTLLPIVWLLVGGETGQRTWKWTRARINSLRPISVCA